MALLPNLIRRSNFVDDRLKLEASLQQRRSAYTTNRSSEEKCTYSFQAQPALWAVTYPAFSSRAATR
jgi:hypothetical protein